MKTSWLCAWSAAVLLMIGVPGVAEAADRPPNVVLVFADDLGYADVGVFGARGYRTPHIDRLAAEGVRFNDFYVAQAVCTASRAALLTGAYPQRVGLTGAVDQLENGIAVLAGEGVSRRKPWNICVVTKGGGEPDFVVSSVER